MDLILTAMLLCVSVFSALLLFAINLSLKEKGKMIIKKLALVFIFYVAGDSLSTFLLSTFSNFEEANPFVLNVLGNKGFLGFLVLKMIIFFVLIFLSAIFWFRITNILLFIVSLAGAITTIYNLLLFFYEWISLFLLTFILSAFSYSYIIFFFNVNVEKIRDYLLSDAV